MVRKLAPTGIAGLVLVSAIAAGVSSPAQAHVAGSSSSAQARVGVKPRITPGTEFEIFYYSNAQHTNNIGERTYGPCGNSFWGKVSSYQVSYEYYCG
jgi:hypothetical protein